MDTVMVRKIDFVDCCCVEVEWGKTPLKCCLIANFICVVNDDFDSFWGYLYICKLTLLTYMPWLWHCHSSVLMPSAVTYCPKNLKSWITPFLEGSFILWGYSLQQVIWEHVDFLRLFLINSLLCKCPYDWLNFVTWDFFCSGNLVS